MLGDDDYAQLTFDMPLTFTSLGAESVELHVRTIDVASDIVMRAEVDVATWRRIYDGGMFHTDGQQEPLGWDDGHTVKLLLRLREPFAREFDDLEALLSDFDDPPAPIRLTEGWVMLEYTQEFDVPDTDGATTEVGIRTSWAE